MSYLLQEKWKDQFLAAHPEFNKNRATVSYGYLSKDPHAGAKRSRRHPETATESATESATGRPTFQMASSDVEPPPGMVPIVEVAFGDGKWWSIPPDMSA